MNFVAKLALGTAQWGLPYGIANTQGQPKDAEIARMLALASQHGVTLIDTAHEYGVAEAAIGNQPLAGNFRIVTKLPGIRAARIDETHVRTIAAAFEASLGRLRRSAVDTLLIHHADDLLAAGADALWAYLESARSAGRTKRVGISVYEPRQVEILMRRYPLDVVQLPYNIYDQRFERTGTLKQLNQMKIEVHARSAFLQGLLLLPPQELAPYFSSIRPHHAEFFEWLSAKGLTPASAALRFSVQNRYIDFVVVGTELATQLEELIHIAALGAHVEVPRSFALEDEAVLNPSNWNLA